MLPTRATPGNNTTERARHDTTAIMTILSFKYLERTELSAPDKAQHCLVTSGSPSGVRRAHDGVRGGTACRQDT